MPTSYDPPKKKKRAPQDDIDLANREMWENVAKEQHKDVVKQRRMSQPLKDPTKGYSR